MDATTLKPCIHSSADDVMTTNNYDVNGVALRCNWHSTRSSDASNTVPRVPMMTTVKLKTCMVNKKVTGKPHGSKTPNPTPLQP